MAAYLDPKTNHHLSEHDKNEAKRHIKSLFNNRRSLRPGNPLSNESLSNQNNAEEIEDGDPFENFMSTLEQSSSRTKTRSKTIIEEIISFEAKLLSFPQRSEDLFKKFWKLAENELPLLYKLSIKFNTFCSGSVPSESSFSVAGYQQRKERSSLDSKTLRFEMIARQIDKLNEIENKL